MISPDPVLKEARRLYELGFAILWLYPNTKRPIGRAWTSGPRKEWNELEKHYQCGFNLGTRLGTGSALDGKFLCALDLDIKSSVPEHASQAREAVRVFLRDLQCPVVRSGRGGGSGHYYGVSVQAFKARTVGQSDEFVKYLSPTKEVSKQDRKECSEEELKKGLRWGRAWELALYSEGRQMVLPPSIHPDTGKKYEWSKSPISRSDFPLFEIPGLASDMRNEGAPLPEKTAGTFRPSQIELDWLPISDTVRDGIVKGTGVTDRSGYLLVASRALIGAGLSENEILTVLTDPETFLGECGYEHARTGDRGRAAAWIKRYTLDALLDESRPETVFGRVPLPPIPNTFSEPGETDWKSTIICGGRRGEGPPLKLIQNVVTILTSEVCESVVRRDLFSYRDAYCQDTPWGGRKNEAVTDDDIARIKFWLGTNFRFEPPTQIVQDALIEIATRHSFDPVKDRLEALPKWDEKPRLGEWLVRHFGAQGEKEYLSQVFTKWMTAMVMRVYEPGSKFDWMPIFEGAQGIGKSSFGRLLVGDRYFLDWLPNLHDKDAALGLQGMWGVEMGELSQFRKNELETIKAFITRTVDKLRPPYGRRVMECPRRCVFFGTTNREFYLSDETGNRRFKPVVVGQLDFRALRRQREQLFSEAKWRFENTDDLETFLNLDGAAGGYEQFLHQSKMVQDDSNAMLEFFQPFLTNVLEGRIDFDLTRFRVGSLFEGGGPLGKFRPENRNLQLAAKMLTKLGFTSRMVRGSKFWRFQSGGGGIKRGAPHLSK